MENCIIALVIVAFIWLLIRAVVCVTWRPYSIEEAPASSFLAYGENGIEYVEGVADEDAEECAADRLCPGGRCDRVVHKFSDGSITIYTAETMRRLGW